MDNLLIEALMNGLGIILLGLITYFANKITANLISFIEDKEIGEELENKKYLASIVVNAVQQIYKEEDGPEKFLIAKSRLVALANRNGVDISKSELDIFIEDAYKAMKEGVEHATDDIKIDSKPKIKIVKKEM